jgi:tubulin polyglutamylase TTLL5
MPFTFNLPSEYTSFVAAFNNVQKCGSRDGNVWIMKPAGMSRGRGIFLVDDIGHVCYSMPFVAQKYITNPLLYNGYKFDLRLYVLVTSFHPLEAFIHEEGFARFSLLPFSCSHDSLGDPRIHLTNSSVQKNFLGEMSASHPVRLADRDGGGSKVRLTWLWRRLRSENKDVPLLWSRIRDSCLKVLLSVDTEIPFQPNCFEVFGFDILIDDSFKVWVLEVNGSPSMSRDYPLDSDIKEKLIQDTVALVDPTPMDHSALADICKERLRQLSGRSIDRGDYYCKNKLCIDLQRIFPRGLPRLYGETPKTLGGFQRLYPKP